MENQRRFDRLATASLTDVDCPDSERLAAYILGMLTGNDQLIVAAHTRDCPLCQQLTVTCRPPESHAPRRLLAQLLPLQPLVGRRGGVRGQVMREYLVAEINMLIELTIAPQEIRSGWPNKPMGASGRITGRVTQLGQPLVALPVKLRAKRYHAQQMTDESGFFTFTELEFGHYTLTIEQPSVSIEIPSLEVEGMED